MIEEMKETKQGDDIIELIVEGFKLIERIILMRKD